MAINVFEFWLGSSTESRMVAVERSPVHVLLGSEACEVRLFEFCEVPRKQLEKLDTAECESEFDLLGNSSNFSTSPGE